MSLMCFNGYAKTVYFEVFDCDIAYSAFIEERVFFVSVEAMMW